MKFFIVKSFIAEFNAFKRMQETDVLSCSLFSWST